ncbi:MAG TPA: FmdB family zinc ribbon protein [Solirubrobacterales bacterium]|nr:FmdB family zinc ribbon protein [Solirubrobacterales bacterium]
MPIYEYRCSNGHTFEVIQRMSDEPIAECEVCGAPVERVFHPVAVHFKGSGFYNTDYGKGKKKGSGADADGAGSDSGSASEKSGGSDDGGGGKTSKKDSGESKAAASSD